MHVMKNALFAILIFSLLLIGCTAQRGYDNKNETGIDTAFQQYFLIFG